LARGARPRQGGDQRRRARGGGRGRRGSARPDSQACLARHAALGGREIYMHGRHLPALGRRFWAALCLASIFGANMGDFFAHDLGLGHVRGLPFLAVAFAVVLVAERFDRLAHEGYYWLAIIIVRTAATNLADFMAGDMRLPRLLVMAGLAILLAVVVTIAWMDWRRSGNTAGNSRPLVLRADTAYWVSMLVAGTLGTVM